MGLLKVEAEQLHIAPATKENVWKGFESFLSDMQKEVSGFFHLPTRSNWNTEIAQLSPVLAKRIPHVDTFIHLGIGGSSLGAEATVKALAPPNAPTFHFLDNIDPDHLQHVLETTSPQRSLVFVVTKSGGTLETVAQFIHVYKWLEKALGADEAKRHLVFCTDPEQGDLRKLANAWQVPCFEIPKSLGGRFSVLSAVGLFPSLVAGIDHLQLLKGAQEYSGQILSQFKKGEIPEVVDLAWRISRLYLEEKRNITVFMPYSQKLKCVAAWFTQLWAESLGKNEKGISPIPAVGATDQHSILQLLRDGPQDKVVCFVEVVGFQNILELKWTSQSTDPRLDSFDLVSGITLNQLIDAELNATRDSLSNAKKPHCAIQLTKLTANSFGQLLFFLETLTALTGYFLEINPFDQPGVEEGKKLTLERIRACKKSSMA